MNVVIDGIPITIQAIMGCLAIQCSTGALEPAADSIGVVGALQLIDQ